MKNVKHIKLLVAHGLLALGLLIAVAGMLTARMIHVGHVELQASRGQLAMGNLQQAAVHARNAASAYVPAAPHVTAAYEQLIDIARRAEGQSDIDSALFAWHALRSAALQTRWFVVTFQPQLDIANQSIARLSAQKQLPAGTSSTSPQTLQRQVHNALTTPNYPNTLWVTVILISFVVGAAGLIYSARKGFTKSGVVVRKHLRIGLIVTTVAVVLWLCGFWFA